MRRCYYVYILASSRRGTLYIGVTSNLIRRLEQHRQNQTCSFTSKYEVYRLVYLEEYQWVYDALDREKRLKKWNRSWKIKLIEEHNPEWYDLLEKGLVSL